VAHHRAVRRGLRRSRGRTGISPAAHAPAPAAPDPPSVSARAHRTVPWRPSCPSLSIQDGRRVRRDAPERVGAIATPSKRRLRGPPYSPSSFFFRPNPPPGFHDRHGRAPVRARRRSRANGMGGASPQNTHPCRPPRWPRASRKPVGMYAPRLHRDDERPIAPQPMRATVYNPPPVRSAKNRRPQAQAPLDRVLPRRNGPPHPRRGACLGSSAARITPPVIRVELAVEEPSAAARCPPRLTPHAHDRGRAPSADRGSTWSRPASDPGRRRPGAPHPESHE